MALPADTPLTATAVATALVSIGLASLVWQRRLARLERLRRQIAEIRRLSREVLRASDESSALALAQEGLREILGDNTLTVSTGRPGEPARRTSRPPFHLRFPMNPQETQTEFLEICHSTEPGFPPEIRESLEDLAYHAGIAAELRSQRHFREQMARTEQLAATGLLLAAIAGDLRQPLESILAQVRGRGLDSIAQEAESALKLVERLAGHGGRDMSRMAVFDLNRLARELCEFRQRAWQLMQADVLTRFSERPVPVRAPEAIVEEALLGLIVMAEQAQQGREEAPRLELAVEAKDGSVAVTLCWRAPGGLPPAIREGVEACRNLLESCGAVLEEDRTAEQMRLQAVFQPADAPSADARARATRHPMRMLTLLLVHPELEALRPLVRALAERNHRVVPVPDAIQALDVAARMRFDAVFAAPGGAGLAWDEFAARMKQHAPVVGWLASAARPAPPGVPALPLAPGELDIDERLAEMEATGRSGTPSQSM